jgi:hypothetical protein
MTNAEIKKAYMTLFKETYFKDSKFINDGLYYSYDQREFVTNSLEIKTCETILSTWEIYVIFQDEENSIGVEIFYNYEREASEEFTYDKPFEIFEFIKKYLKSEENVLC